MSKYEIGDRIPNGEPMIRRFRLRWLKRDRTISWEAFRPKLDANGQFEDGVSVDLKRFLRYPIGNDYWSNERKMATGQFLSDVVNALPSYELVFNGPSPSHCIITGEMAMLYYDYKAMNAIAKETACIHNPVA